MLNVEVADISRRFEGRESRKMNCVEGSNEASWVGVSWCINELSKIGNVSLILVILGKGSEKMSGMTAGYRELE